MVKETRRKLGNDFRFKKAKDGYAPR